MKNFLSKIMALGLVTVVIISIVAKFKTEWYHAYVPTSIIFSLIITFLVHGIATGWGKDIIEPKPTKMLAAFVVHFLGFLSFYATMLWLFTGYDLLFTAWFLAFFIIFSVFEVLNLLTILQPQK